MLEAKQQDQCGTLSGTWWPRLVVGILLVLCGMAVYRPALNRVFAGDQLSFFLELDGETSLASGLRFIDYSVARQYEKGDEGLYRPLMHAWLAMENAAFGRDFQAWNSASLWLHLAVAYLLFEVLWHRHRTWLAGGIALWFALLASNFEQVSWNHLGGYMFGYGLLLVALWAAREMTQATSNGRWLGLYAIAMTGAMLVHEIAVVAAFGAVAFGVGCCRKKPDTRWTGLVAAWGVPILIYVVLYAFHLARCERVYWVDPHAVAVSPWARTMALPALLWQWTVHILLPGQGQLATQVYFRSSWAWPAGGWSGASVVAGAAWVGLGASLWRGFTRQRCKQVWPFAAWLAFLIVSYAGMNWMGRSNAVQVAYYAYCPALIGAVLAYSLVDFSRVGQRSRTCALALLLVLAATNGWQTWQTSRMIEEANRPAADFQDWLEGIVGPRLSEPDFRFAVNGVPPDLNPQGPVTVGYPGSPVTMTKSLLQCLYGKHYDMAAADAFVYPGLPPVWR